MIITDKMQSPSSSILGRDEEERPANQDCLDFLNHVRNRHPERGREAQMLKELIQGRQELTPERCTGNQITQTFKPLLDKCLMETMLGWMDRQTDRSNE